MVTSTPAATRPLMRFLARFHPWKPAQHLAEARRALRANNLDLASEAIERAMRRAPAWAEPHVLNALVLRAQGKGKDAEEASLLAALERNPGHQGAEQQMLAIRAWRHEPLTHAWHLYYGKRYAEALEAFRAALLGVGTRLPESERAACLAGMGWCHHGYGRADWGLQAFDEALQVEPDLPHALKGKGICLYLLGRYVEAEATLFEALALEPRLLDGKCFIGWSRYARGMFVEALAIFTEVTATREASGDAHWGSAWCAWRLDRVEQAAESFARGLALAPRHPSQGDFLSLVLPDARYAPLAAQVGRPAPPASSEASPAYPAVLTDALEALVLDKPDRALEILKLAPEDLARHTWRKHILSGRALLALGENAQALQAFKLAHRAAPLRVEPTLAAADLLRADGRSKKAEGLLLKALKRQPQNDALRQAHIEHLMACGHDSQAKEKQEQWNALVEEALEASREIA